MFKYALIGVAGYLLLASKKKEVMDTISDAAFKATLPAGVSTYAEHLTRAGAKYGVSRWILAALMQRESNGGMTLRPVGPNGTGDFIARSATGTYAPFMDPNTGLPIDGQGWGRGLMQIDYGAHNAWVLANPWWEPQVNIEKAAQIFAEGRDRLAKAGLVEPVLTPAALAAYNTGVANVLRSIAAGKDPSATTTGADYAQAVIARVAQWTAQAKA